MTDAVRRGTGRDRLRELLDAVLDGDDGQLDAMAARAYSSPFHFSRQLRELAGEPPVAMRRRVMLERAAWRLRSGASVTDAALEAGYESVEGFGRAFARAHGVPPSAFGGDHTHWLAAPNGIHFHPPISLWIDSGGPGGRDRPTWLLIEHDLADTRALLRVVVDLPAAEPDRVRLPGSSALPWHGPDETIAQLAEHLVDTLEQWLAAIEGTEPPAPTPGLDLLARHDAAATRWRSALAEIDRRGAWQDRIVDAICDPPESFVISSIVAHVITFDAHRRMLLRWMLAETGAATPDPDPISWLRTTNERQ
ncbi:helix-turn-helix domain-containing protein [Naumannella huperziae]